MIKNVLFYCLLVAGMLSANGQHAINLKAQLDDSLKTIQVKQELLYHNASSDSLQEIFLTDWANAYSSKVTPLGRRFSDDYVRRFHFSDEEERGHTTIFWIRDKVNQDLSWERPAGSPDLLKIKLPQALPAGESFTISLDYEVKIPHEEFTHYGYDDLGNFKLRYWFVTPGVYQKQWKVFSHKNLDDRFLPPMDLDLHLEVPFHLGVVSALSKEATQNHGLTKTVSLKGNNRTDTRVFLVNEQPIEKLQTSTFQIISNLETEGLDDPSVRNQIATRVGAYLEEKLGPYPYESLLVTQEDYDANPLYGLNQLPEIVRPYSNSFTYDLKLLKVVSETFVKNTLFLHPREEKWISDAILIYLFMDYVDAYYPDAKLLGKYSDYIGVRWFHAADLDYNDQFPLLYIHMARENMDQALATQSDSLLKFNEMIANPYKAGVGLRYLDAYLGNGQVKKGLKEFYQEYNLQQVNQDDFHQVLNKSATKDIDWFFNDYAQSGRDIDFRFENVRKRDDRLEITVENKTGVNIPVPLYGLKDGEIVFQQWLEDVDQAKTFNIPAAGIDRLALNYEGIIPEINQRDNYWGVNTLFNKPLQLRLITDVEDPRYSQMFLIPHYRYNLYDGIALGPRLHNKSLPRKNFHYDLAPLFGFGSKTLIGTANLTHQIPFEDKKMYSLSYGISGSRFSFGYGDFYERVAPFIQLNFRNADLRDTKRQTLRIRSVNVMRDEVVTEDLEVPDYNIFNINYRYNDKGMVDYLTGDVDFQLSQHFSKFAVTTEYRKLFRNNRQINLRFFGGVFLYNDLSDNHYFSFALDRPSDYLFDFNYYGRSETSGFFSQQIIMAEGGFKSQLQPEFANQWMTTVNASTNLWKWIYVYGDLGLVKNKYSNAKFVYDAGIRLNFVEDYFELFLPIYSNLGWEIADDNYDQKIRFIITLDLPNLMKIFSREWY